MKLTVFQRIGQPLCSLEISQSLLTLTSTWRMDNGEHEEREGVGVQF